MMMNEMILIAGLWAISYTVVDIFMADEWKFNTHRGRRYYVDEMVEHVSTVF